MAVSSTIKNVKKLTETEDHGRALVAFDVGHRLGMGDLRGLSRRIRRILTGAET